MDTARLLYNSEILAIAAEKMLNIAYSRGATHIGGEATSALPLIGAITSLSFLKGRGLSGFMIRKELKPYGKSNLIEGEIPTGSRVLLVDDVTGTGSAAVRCCGILQSAGVEIVGYSSIVDRQEQASQSLCEQFSVELLPLLTIGDFQGVKI
ncbi:hypothetical protein J7E78_11265 [Paenibacillus polymyxa]|uniref:orotate phosphoribosyltransferase n=1 Tax=Paenibacillus polymyxa TaxID=1406 RepID=UPI001BE83381|nr:hypothetical protein [Paenibacillus polymyxa]MBT2284119.1 hypothetical protein [Paenibacillus polymyxa]